MTVPTASGVGSLAGADEHQAGIVLWNENTDEKSVNLTPKHLAFARGTVSLYRIDAKQGSYIDNAVHERLQGAQSWKFTGSSTTWRGMLPGESVIFLKIADDSAKQILLSPAKFGAFVRHYYWFADRASTAYADFDPRTAIARVGLGNADIGIAQIGSVIDNAPKQLSVQVKRSGPFTPKDANGLLGLRIDFATAQGYTKSVLFHDGSYQLTRTSTFP